MALRANQNKHLIKGLIAYYGELQSSYVSQAEHHGSKLIETLPLPFHETFFLPATDHQGYQGALTQIRDRSRALSAALAEMGQSIETQVISVLQSARSDIKALLKQMDEELGMLTETVDKSRADAAQALRDHDAGLALYESPSHSSFSANNAHQDPFLTHGITSLHLNNQVDLENKQLRITLQYQSLWRDLEMKINTAIVQASQSFLEIQLMGDVKLKAEFAGIEEAISNVSAQGTLCPSEPSQTRFDNSCRTAEWDLFAQPPRIVNDQTQPRNESVAALFPAQDHAASQPLFSGPLDRQRSLTRSFATFYFVLTPSGFLHEFDAGGLFDVTDVDKLNPHLSIFLSDFTLSQPSNFDDPKGQRFSLTGPRGSASGKDAQQGLGGSFGLGKSSLVTYVFKANERDQLLDWWDACKRYCKLSPGLSFYLSSRSR